MKTLRCLLILLPLLWGVEIHARATVEEQVLGPANAGGWYVFSPSGARVAYAGTRGSRVGVIVDGVEGPTFDELYTPYGTSFMSPPTIAAITASQGGRTNQAAQGAPVIMSTDGKHYAYIGRQGEEYVVVHDGKEIARGPATVLSLNYNPLTLSPGGQHVYWNESNGKGSTRWLQRLLIDGKPGPWSGHQDILPVFSPDEARHAYTYVSPDDANKHELIVDGKPAGYSGQKPLFTADGKHLITFGYAANRGLEALLVNGKPVIKTRGIQKVVPAPVGSGYAAIAFKEISGSSGAYVLYIDGKEIPGTENVKDVWFSPDGQHYAAAVENTAARAMYMVIDGKKQREYQGVNISIAPTWFAGSNRLIYNVTSGGRSFVIVDEQEFEIAYLGTLMATPQQNHYAWHSYDGSNRKHSLIIDGKDVLLPGFYPRGYDLSSNGERHAYQVSQIGRSDIAGFVIDGKLVEGFFPSDSIRTPPSNKQGAPGFLFSPNGRHLVVAGGYADPESAGLYIDGKLVQPSRTSFTNLTFTPDSNHLAWLASEKMPDRPRPYPTVYLDGEPVVRLDSTNLLLVRGAWDMATDGTLNVIEQERDQVKRFRVIPDTGMTIAKWVSQADAMRARQQAEQQAAQQQAAENAAAAKAQADADRAEAAARAKADAEAAAAKRKADYEAAVAAKQAAYAAAVEAKRQARLLQLENAKRAKQGLPPLKALPEQ